MPAVDTNVLVRLLTGDDARQASAAESFVERNGPVWVPLVVLVETAWVLESVYDRSRGEIAAAVETLLDHADFVVQDADAVAKAVVEFKARSGVGFSDCVVLETVRKASQLPLATFDRNLSSLSGALHLKR